jgi:hypothetical protein
LFSNVSRYGGRLRKLIKTVRSDFLRQYDLYIPPDGKDYALYQKQNKTNQNGKVKDINQENLVQIKYYEREMSK